MFEKEAEERITEQFGTSGEYITRQRIWQDGAEFGYNKCKEELNQKGLALQSDMDKTIEQNIALKKELNKANEWHCVKDGDLPKEYDTVLVCTEFEKHKSCLICNYHYGKWWYADGKYADEVIAWKEIVLPKESE